MTKEVIMETYGSLLKFATEQEGQDYFFRGIIPESWSVRDAIYATGWTTFTYDNQMFAVWKRRVPLIPMGPGNVAVHMQVVNVTALGARNFLWQISEYERQIEEGMSWL